MAENGEKYMKQRVDPEQIRALTKKQKEKLRDLWTISQGDFYLDEDDETHVRLMPTTEATKVFTRGYYPLLNIGQMLELLGDGWNDDAILNADLCDFLWWLIKERFLNE